ncbi:MAG: hypothetical protein QOC60_808, partial [Frankiaceae bacterium]|nr:hypothetical protein [Frankiaceae bacterium]
MNEHLGPNQEPDETHLRLLLDSLATPPSRLSAPREAIFRKAARLRRRRAVASALAAAAAVAVVAIAPSAFLTHRSPTPIGSPPVSSATVASRVPTPTPTPIAT